jgi:hypothetical protein
MGFLKGKDGNLNTGMVSKPSRRELFLVQQPSEHLFSLLRQGD